MSAKLILIGHDVMSEGVFASKFLGKNNRPAISLVQGIQEAFGRHNAMIIMFAQREQASALRKQVGDACAGVAYLRGGVCEINGQTNEISDLFTTRKIDLVSLLGGGAPESDSFDAKFKISGSDYPSAFLEFLIINVVKTRGPRPNLDVVSSYATLHGIAELPLQNPGAEARQLARRYNELIEQT